MQYFYFWGILFVLPFTIFAYYKADKALRIKMIVSGIGFGILSVIFDRLFFDYWKPVYIFKNFHFEDFLYGFLFAGILPAVHNIIFKEKLDGKYGFNIKLSILYIIILIGIFWLWVKVLNLNHIYALAIVPFIIGIISAIKVNGRIRDIFITVVASIVITFTFYTIIIVLYPEVFTNHYFSNNVTSLFLLKIPIEEWLFAIGLGVGCTYTYEAVFKLN